MSFAAENGFHFVYDIDMLSKVVAFLQSGFGWGKNRTNDIMAHFERLNTTAPKAAFFCQNGEIKIAILLFDQTSIENSSNKIINLSSWYAKESHRGVDAIQFARKLTSQLCGYTITNYTPSVAAKKVLTWMGYEYVNVEVDSFGLDKQFPFIQLKGKRKYFSFKRGKVEPSKLSSDQNLATSQSAFRLSTVRKMGINLNILNIFLGKDKSYISFPWLIKHLLFHGVVKVNVYSEIDTIPSESPWLIKNIQAERYISPHKSELSV